MATIIDARVRQKTDTLTNWLANDLILLEGEQAFVLNSLGQPVNFRIGDGTKRFSELPDWIDYSANLVINTIAPGGTLSAPAQAGKITFLQPGTYNQPTTGTLTVPINTIGIAFWNGTIWSLTNFTISAAAYLPTWTAIVWASGAQVFYNGQIYKSNASTLATDVPGISTKWNAQIDKLTVNRRYPFDDTLTIDAIPVDLREFILEIELYLDDTKRYYVSYIGNYYNTGTGRVNYFRIADVATTTQVAAYGNSTGAVVVTSQSTGIELLTLYSATSAIVGYVLVNWDKCYPAGGRSGTLTASQGLLSKLVSYKRTFQLPKILYSKAPFTVNSTFNVDYPDWFKAIEKIELYGANPLKRYYIKTFARKRVLNDYYYIIIEEEGHSAATGVCYYNTALTENANGVNILLLAATAGTGITGKVWINYNKIVSTADANLITATINQTELSSVIHAASSAIPATVATDRLLAAKEVWLVEGNKLPLYKAGLLTTEYSTGSKLGVSVTTTSLTMPLNGYINDGVYHLDAAAFNDGDTGRIFQQFPGNSSLYFMPVTFKKKALSYLTGKTAEVFIFGDSMTEGVATGKPVVPYVGARMLTEWSSAVTFRGVKGTAPYKNEGRSSWEYSILCGLDTLGYTPSTGSSALNTNVPFLKVATSPQLAAHPEWCFENQPSLGLTGKLRELNYTQSQAIGTYSGNYYTFDFARYITDSINIGTPIDPAKKLIVTCSLGFNDLNHNNKSEQSIVDALLGIEIFCTRIYQYNAAVIIGISPIVSVNQANNWPAFTPYIERAMDKVATLRAGGINVFVLPIYQSVDRINDYDYNSQTDLTATNHSKVGVSTDLVHPSPAGAKEHANVISYFIANNL